MELPRLPLSVDRYATETLSIGNATCIYMVAGGESEFDRSELDRRLLTGAAVALNMLPTDTKEKHDCAPTETPHRPVAPPQLAGRNKLAPFTVRKLPSALVRSSFIG